MLLYKQQDMRLMEEYQMTLTFLGIDPHAKIQILRIIKVNKGLFHVDKINIEVHKGNTTNTQTQ